MILSFTFDDGNISQIRDFYPILRRHKLPATFYVVTGEIGQPGKLTFNDLLFLAQDKNEIGSHGVTHRSLVRLRRHELRNELANSRDFLRSFDVKTFAYPFGQYDANVISNVAESYESARAYGRSVVANNSVSLRKYELQSFPVEREFSSRLDQNSLDYLLKLTDKRGDAWYIVTLHGRASINRQRLASAMSLAKITNEQLRAYLGDISSRIMYNRRDDEFMEKFNRFCGQLNNRNVMVTTVSRALEMLV
jgi:peptidoglycan/xylan/chitin deacetylase (PgdA/CDA1 family)